jgi:hypothetical protein
MGALEEAGISTSWQDSFFDLPEGTGFDRLKRFLFSFVWFALAAATVHAKEFKTPVCRKMRLLYRWRAASPVKRPEYIRLVLAALNTV